MRTMTRIVGGTRPSRSASAAQAPSPPGCWRSPPSAAPTSRSLYAGDVWTAKLDGSDVRRITTADGDESNPVFSDDGRWLAFAGNYDGNVDVYVVPAPAARCGASPGTPATTSPQAFTPRRQPRPLHLEPRRLLQRYTQLWTVAAGGGPEEKLPIPNAAQASYSPDGRSSPTTRSAALRAVEGLSRRPRLPALAHQYATAGMSRKSRSRRDTRTTSMACGSTQTRSGSAPTAKASSTSIATTGARRPSPA